MLIAVFTIVLVFLCAGAFFVTRGFLSLATENDRRSHGTMLMLAGIYLTILAATLILIGQ